MAPCCGHVCVAPATTTRLKNDALKIPSRSKNNQDLPVYHTERLPRDPLVCFRRQKSLSKTNPLPPLYSISPLLFPRTLAHSPTRARSPFLASRSDHRQSRRPRPRRGHTESSRAGVVSAVVNKTPAIKDAVCYYPTHRHRHQGDGRASRDGRARCRHSAFCLR